MTEQPEQVNFGDRVEYRIAGKLHREDGPAIELADGSKAWYVDGKRHRTDGPAIEWGNGHKEWYVDGECHRLDGPAIEREDGTKTWYVYGKRHRLDGPAREWVNGVKEWYIMGRKVSKPDVDNLRLKTLTFSFALNRRIWKKTIMCRRHLASAI